uniref:Uncharacterized protein n=1 Tax=Meloidogyne hapla TaxID=6305 RepID=A0A1I8B8U5_MELHA
MFIKIKIIFYLFLIFYLTDSQECDCKCTPDITPDNVEGPLTHDLQTWLSTHGYYDLEGFGSKNSYGGRTYKKQKISKRPVIFIHGNSDGALADSDDEWNQGWSNSISYFLSNGGYTSAELYAITYGERDITKSLKHIIQVQKRLILLHIQWVLLMQELLFKGICLFYIICKLGNPLNNKTRNFIAIAGANYGLCGCSDREGETTNDTKRVPVCGKE